MKLNSRSSRASGSNMTRDPTISTLSSAQRVISELPAAERVASTGQAPAWTLAQGALAQETRRTERLGCPLLQWGEWMMTGSHRP